MLFLIQFDRDNRPYRRMIRPTAYLAPRLYYIDEDGLAGEVDMSPSVYLWDGSYAVIGAASREYWAAVDCGYDSGTCRGRYMDALRRRGVFVDEDGLAEIIAQQELKQEGGK